MASIESGSHISNREASHKTTARAYLCGLAMLAKMIRDVPLGSTTKQAVHT
jgi:hypothetical protein